jgi:hypothetical protein
VSVITGAFIGAELPEDAKNVRPPLFKESRR